LVLNITNLLNGPKNKYLNPFDIFHLNMTIACLATANKKFSGPVGNTGKKMLAFANTTFSHAQKRC